MSAKQGFGSVVGTVLDGGVKAAELSQKLASVSLDASRKLMHGQFALGSGLAGLAVAQVRSFGSVTRPGEFLRRQKAAGESLYAEFGSYARTLRGIGADAYQGYGAVAGELFSRARKAA